jgi:leucyl-tRNA synthetase
MILGKTYRAYRTKDDVWINHAQRGNYEELSADNIDASRVEVVAPADVSWDGDIPMHPVYGVTLEIQIEKMSKSLGNVVNPDAVIEEYGADALRMYEMFMGPLEQAKPWDQRSVNGVYRFLTRTWRLLCEDQGLHERVTDAPISDEVNKALHTLLKRVGEETEAMRFNTAIASMMEYINFLYKEDTVPKAAVEPFVITLAPYAPHIAEELWNRLGHEDTIVDAAWPEHDPAVLVEDTVEIAVQVMGKMRATIALATDADEATAVAIARSNPDVEKYIEGKTIRRVIFVPGRILNFVVS